MQQMKQLRSSEGNYIAYYQTPGILPGVIYLSGYRSDMNGDKATFLEKHCREQGRAFIRFDYFGHGASTGSFEDGYLGLWKNDALAVLDELTTGPQILVGSSMGGWIMLLLAVLRPERMAGLLGIAPAPDFTKDILEKLKTSYRDDLLANGVCYVPSYGDEPPYPVTMKLIEEGTNHHLLEEPIPIHCPVRLIHGTRDKDIPWQQSISLMNALASDDVEITLIKRGNHRLSSENNLKVLAQVLDSFFNMGKT